LNVIFELILEAFIVKYPFILVTIFYNLIQKFQNSISINPLVFDIDCSPQNSTNEPNIRFKSKRGIGQIFWFGLVVLYSDWTVYNLSEPVNKTMILKHVEQDLYFSFVCIVNEFIIVRSSGQVFSLDGVAFTNSTNVSTRQRIPRRALKILNIGGSSKTVTTNNLSSWVMTFSSENDQMVRKETLNWKLEKSFDWKHSDFEGWYDMSVNLNVLRS